MGLRLPQSQPIDEFELMRRRIQGKGGQRADLAQRDVRRHFAALGNIDSGTALKLQQQTAQEQEDLTNQQVEDVNILEAQTRQKERESALDRDLQKYGIDTQVGAQRDIAKLQAGTSLDIAKLQDVGETTRLGTTLSSQEKIAQLGYENAMTIAKLEADTNTNLQKMNLSQARTIAQWDRELKKSGLSIQRMIAEDGIKQGRIESTINIAATFINSIPVLRKEGFNDQQILDMFDTLNLPIRRKHIGVIIDKNIIRDLPGQLVIPNQQLPRNEIRPGEYIVQTGS